MTSEPAPPRHTFFHTYLAVREDGRYWRLTEPLTYRGARDTWTVPAGFRTDLASVPRLLTPLVPTSGEHNRAAVLHDYLCRQPQVSYRDADEVLRIVATQLGVARTRVWLLYAGVRVGHEVLGLGYPRGADPGPWPGRRWALAYAGAGGAALVGLAVAWRHEP
jgi:hypothetical protein